MPGSAFPWARSPAIDDEPVVVIRPCSQQPRKAEIELDVSVDATPATMRAVLIRAETVEESERPGTTEPGTLTKP